MRTIVTGGAGFLGRHLCRSLSAAGHEVQVLDLHENPEFPTTIADIRDESLMKKEIKDADVVFHLAALIEAGESVKNPQAFVDTNITGSLNVLEAMRENDISTLIFSSTAAVYGEPISIPIKEDDRTIPINPYGVTKLALEGLLSSYVQSYGFTGIALRYFNLYGPEELHQPETHAIPRFISQMYNDQEVTVWGEGQHQRDFIYVQDVVDAHLDALRLATEQPQLYHYINLATSKPTSVKTVIDLIAAALKKEPNLKFFPNRPGDPLILAADASKAKQLLNWVPKTSIEEGITKTVEYFVANWK